MKRPSLLSAGLVLLAAGLALAQPAAAQRRPDFLFKTPMVTLGFRVGYALPSASSDLFDFTRQELTVNRSDFGSATWEGELAVRAAKRMDVVMDVGYARSRTPSELRDWVGTDNLPIEQTTTFKRVPLTFGVKAYLADRGRSVGRFAWIPTRWAPFVGAGAGWVWYTFDQKGDFVDYQTLDVFPDHFTSDGSAPTIHLFGGADWSLSPSFVLTGEARYSWARADLSGDFVDFHRLDLSGFQATAGISVRF